MRRQRLNKLNAFISGIAVGLATVFWWLWCMAMMGG